MKRNYIDIKKTKTNKVFFSYPIPHHIFSTAYFHIGKLKMFRGLVLTSSVSIANPEYVLHRIMGRVANSYGFSA